MCGRSMMAGIDGSDMVVCDEDAKMRDASRRRLTGREGKRWVAVSELEQGVRADLFACQRCCETRRGERRPFSVAKSTAFRKP